MFYHIVVALFAILLVCIQKSHAIPNGQTLNSLEHPEIVRLLMYKQNEEKLLVQSDTCSGVAISNFLVLTAGHCVTGKNNEGVKSVALHRFTSENKVEIILADSAYTEYIPEDLQKAKDEQNEGAVVPGCVPRPKPILQTKTPDLAIIKFPNNTFKKWAQIDLAAVLNTGDDIEYFGYGVKTSSLVSAMPPMDPQPDDLRSAANKIWRTTEKRSAIIAPPMEAFADQGDSGAPVFHDGAVVGVMSTMDEKCETAYGDDYALMNTITNLSSLESLDFFINAIHTLVK